MRLAVSVSRCLRTINASGRGAPLTTVTVHSMSRNEQPFNFASRTRVFYIFHFVLQVTKFTARRGPGFSFYRFIRAELLALSVCVFFYIFRYYFIFRNAAENVIIYCRFVSLYAKKMAKN